jgi:hypothetical protein
MHFPLRSRRQWLHKVKLQGDAFTKHIERAGTGYHLTAYSALQGGRIDDQYRTLVVDDVAVERGLHDGTLARDQRLCDALRALRLADGEGRTFALPAERNGELAFPQPSPDDDVAYAVEAAVLGEADAVRIQRRLDAFERRLAALES